MNQNANENVKKSPESSSWVWDVKEKLSESMTNYEFRSVMNQLAEMPLHIRTLGNFMLTTGCRINEVLNLKVEDVNLTICEAKILNRSKKTQSVYLNPELCLLLGKTLSERQSKESCVFLNAKGEALNYLDVKKALKDLGKKAGLERNLTPALCRSNFNARMAMPKGLSIEEISFIMGTPHNYLEKMYQRKPIKDPELKAKRISRDTKQEF